MTTTNWRKVWKDFEQWINEKTVGPVAWPRQKRAIQRLVKRHSSDSGKAQKVDRVP